MEAAAALRILRTKSDPETIGFVVAHLREIEAPGLRDALLHRYHQFAEDPARLDATCPRRTELLRGLRGLALPADQPLLEQVATMYEYGYTGELAGNMRAAAVVALAGLDEAAAAFHAARLLFDEHTNRMSGEPALGAARVLAAQGELLPLYGYLLMHDGSPEVLAECFRAMGPLPEGLLRPLAIRYFEAGDEITLLGLVDLLVDHPRPVDVSGLLLSWLEVTQLVDLYRYAVTAIVAGHREPLLTQLQSMLPPAHPAKARVLAEAISLLYPA